MKIFYKRKYKIFLIVISGGLSIWKDSYYLYRLDRFSVLKMLYFLN